MKAKTLTYIIDASHVRGKGERADKVLSRLEGLPSRSQVKLWFQDGRVRRGLETIDGSSVLHEGDKIKVSVPAPRRLNLEPKKMDLQILHEDEDLIVLYKPKGLSMHPGAGQKDTITLAHGLMAHSKNLSTTGGEFRPGIVHRLDKNTEGVVVIAKNNEVHENLSRQFSNREIDRAYWALCWGKFPTQMIIDAPIGRNPRDRKKMAVVSAGRESKTEARLIKYFEEGYSWVECKLHTGRTHQIRVHLTHKKYGLLGDHEYAKRRKLDWSEKKEAAYENLNGQALVAFRLGFTHPRTGEKLKFEVEKPAWLKIFIET
ncbi:MAG: RluA family pseudouridine synthase [Bacteriovoracaceae bacterium]|nr:RluA family pseudouridine synthase [Bacteriovoracaceae bacterium]